MKIVTIKSRACLREDTLRLVRCSLASRDRCRLPSSSLMLLLACKSESRCLS